MSLDLFTCAALEPYTRWTFPHIKVNSSWSDTLPKGWTLRYLSCLGPPSILSQFH